MNKLVPVLSSRMREGISYKYTVPIAWNHSLEVVRVYSSRYICVPFTKTAAVVMLFDCDVFHSKSIQK